MANPNPNPKNRFKKGHAPVAGGGRPPGATNILTKDMKTLLREAAANTGFMERVPVLDAAGKPTGQFEHKWGKGGELGYLEWLARNHPGYFAALYGRLIPLDVNQKAAGASFWNTIFDEPHAGHGARLRLDNSENCRLRS